MGLLDQLIGNPPSQQHQDYQDFINRYQQGAPQEGYSNQEVLSRYQQVAPELDRQQYLDAAIGAAQRLSPQERTQLAQYLQQQAQQQQVPLPSAQQSANYAQDPNALGQLLTHVHQQQPSLLGQLLGGGNSGGNAGGGGLQQLNNPIAKAALAGIAALAAKRIMG